MKNSWEFPSRSLVLENEAVAISGVDLGRDLLQLYEAASLEGNERFDLFQFHVNVPPMTDLRTFEKYLSGKLGQPSEVVYKIFSKRLGRPVGCASLMNIRQDHGVVEVGSIWLTRFAQRTEINTNAMYLLFCYVFEALEYRRLEWKCNSKNEASVKAALRLGFEHEGRFRQHFVTRGENRDTDWFSIIDAEWKEKKKALERQLRRTSPRV